MSPRRHPIALPTTLLLVIALAGCPSDDNGDPPVKPKGEKLEPEPPGPPPPAPDPDVRLTCVGSNAPKAMKGAVLELVGYVRALSDPDAKKAPPKAQITAYSNEGKQLSKPVFADVQEGKDGRVTLPVPVKSEGFTGYAVVTHTGFLDWRLRNSRPLTTTEYDGWAWLTTPDEVKERGEALGITQSDDNGILLGAVHDCDGFGVQYSVVLVNGKTDGIYYVEGFDLVTDRTYASDTGRWVMPNAAPGTYEIKAFGRLEKDGPLYLLSIVEATVEAGKMTAVSLQPRVGLKK